MTLRHGAGEADAPGLVVVGRFMRPVGEGPQAARL